jgi:glycerophosphoryl diester phosphodiesterase
MQDQIRIISHRGFGTDEYGDKGYHENSLDAFSKGFSVEGVHACETDVRYTQDRKIVCYHDPEINKVPVSKYTLPELRELKPYIPTFKEVMEKFPDKKFIIELKPKEDNAAIVDEIFTDYIASDKNPNRFMFISFCIEDLLLVKEKRQETYCIWITTSLFYDPKRFSLFVSKKDIELCRDHGIDEIAGYHLSFSYTKVKLIKSSGIKVGIGPTNDLKVLKKALSLEVDSIYTDKPEAIIQAL